jgi:hypothetical protein
VRLHPVDVTVTDEQTGEHLRHYALQDGDVVVVEAVLTASEATEQCLPVQVRTKQKEQLAGHLHALRLPPEQAAAARRRARAAATKKGRQIQARTLALVEWVLI